METFSLALDAILSNYEGEPGDWACHWASIKKLTDPAIAKFQSPKLDMYVTLMEKGVVFPPIVVTKDYEVIDGTHRYNAYLRLERKMVPVLRWIKPGQNKVVKNTVYKKGRFIKPTEPPECYLCQSPMQFVAKDEIKTSASFPEGLPRGPFYFCEKDRFIINYKNYVLWSAL